ncbi:MAG: hypothetical protein WCK44_01010 [Actinomycetota bacterium]|jgi:hypothetical protein
MSKRDQSGDFDDDLVNAEFESMVEGLSLDESSPTTYLDELDSFVDTNKFIPPIPPKKSLKEQYRDAKNSVIRWKNNRNNENPEDGAAL